MVLVRVAREQRRDEPALFEQCPRSESDEPERAQSGRRRPSGSQVLRDGGHATAGSGRLRVGGSAAVVARLAESGHFCSAERPPRSAVSTVRARQRKREMRADSGPPTWRRFSAALVDGKHRRCIKQRRRREVDRALLTAVFAQAAWLSAPSVEVGRSLACGACKGGGPAYLYAAR